MGVFGIGVFDNDKTLDLAADYLECLSKGLIPQQAESFVIRRFEATGGNAMWIALANIEWCYGFLSNEVRCIALEVIKREKKNLMNSKKVVPYIAALHKVYDD